MSTLYWQRGAIEITKPGSSNRCYALVGLGEPDREYTGEQMVAIMLEEYDRGFRSLTDAQARALAAQVSEEVRAWARGLPSDEAAKPGVAR